MQKHLEMGLRKRRKSLLKIWDLKIINQSLSLTLPCLFKALNAGDPLLFKLHAPYNFIAGGGFSAHSTLLPVSFAWDGFRERNGAATFQEMRHIM
jgi:hypothetical protein